LEETARSPEQFASGSVRDFIATCKSQGQRKAMQAVKQLKKTHTDFGKEATIKIQDRLNNRRRK
jgi:hypothetical protein